MSYSLSSSITNKKYKQRRREQGLCPNCGKIPEKGYYCERCLAKKRERSRINRVKLKFKKIGKLVYEAP